ncbi:30S ribosomal protein S6 [Candidatus Legionella polyplacis]|uniref:30S ribosomal protein S6 n=1 Tax=Candidatus Legionella polyplacis TaxID=2005262 RepID=UPI001313E102|nr:30S ribosomal protein S6 [Candidatus Legionella polyplacis]
MRYYELVILIHPDKSDQLIHIVNKYEKIVLESNGEICYKEDCGRRQLAYTIRNVYKANYYLLYVRCDKKVINNIQNILKFDGNIIRFLIIKKDRVIKVPSFLSKKDNYV